MDRRNLLLTLVGCCSLSAGPLLAQGRGRGHGRGEDDRPGHDDHEERHGPDSRYFRGEHYAVLQRYYAGPRDLPPGLRKKYYRTGKLPPGWQAKIRPFPPEVVRVLPPPPPNCERGYIEGVAVVYDRT